MSVLWYNSTTIERLPENPEDIPLNLVALNKSELIEAANGCHSKAALAFVNALEGEEWLASDFEHMSAFQEAIKGISDQEEIGDITVEIMDFLEDCIDSKRHQILNKERKPLTIIMKEEAPIKKVNAIKEKGSVNLHRLFFLAKKEIEVPCAQLAIARNNQKSFENAKDDPRFWAYALQRMESEFRNLDEETFRKIIEEEIKKRGINLYHLLQEYRAEKDTIIVSATTLMQDIDRRILQNHGEEAENLMRLFRKLLRKVMK